MWKIAVMNGNGRSVAEIGVVKRLVITPPKSTHTGNDRIPPRLSKVRMRRTVNEVPCTAATIQLSVRRLSLYELYERHFVEGISVI